MWGLLHSYDKRSIDIVVVVFIKSVTLGCVNKCGEVSREISAEGWVNNSNITIAFVFVYTIDADDSR